MWYNFKYKKIASVGSTYYFGWNFDIPDIKVHDFLKLLRLLYHIF